MKPMSAQQQNFLINAGLWAVIGLLLWDAYHDFWEILHFDWYRVMQADMPDWLVCVRYIVSVTLRVLMFWAIAGIITRQEWHRKLLIGLCLFNAATFFLHHRYASFIYISSYLGLNTEDFLTTARWFGHHFYPGAVLRMLDAWVREIVIALVGFAFFINPRIKRLFQ